MRPFHNTPQCFGLPPVEKPALTGAQLLYKLEDEYAEYRRDCGLGLCKSDPKEHARFALAIAKARE